MADNVQTWSLATGTMFYADPKVVTFAHELNDAQGAKVFEAWGLWDDVSNLKAVWDYTDDDNLARDMTRTVTDDGHTHWAATLPGNWTRISMGEVIDGDGTANDTIGINISKNLSNHEPTRYHEVYVDDRLDGADTLQLGSQSFSVLVHEIGHSVLDFVPDVDGTLGGHIPGAPTEAIMNPDALGSDDITREHYSDAWFAATPMTLDINAAIAHYGPAWTRPGDDTYGFNAHFSGDYRAALDFDKNTRPLITIYDSDGNDTLDASGFDGRPVRVDLNPGGHSWMLDTPYQTFAVIYQGPQQTTWIENAVGGDGNDQLFGNERANILSGNGGNDLLDGRAGADTMMGGEGDDTYYVDDAGDWALDWPWDAGGLHDTVHTELASFDLSNWQVASGIEDLVFDDDYLDLFTPGREATRHTGIGSDVDNIITGSRGIDTLIGNGGNDTLDGGAGDDYMAGGKDNDTYIVDSYGDTVDEETFSSYGFSYDSGGIDTIQTNLSSYALPENFDSRIENLVYTGNGTFVGVGNSLDNLIVGGFGGDAVNGNSLFGGKGSDRLYGFDGADMLIGGEGDDKMSGGRGDDDIIMDNGTALGSEFADGGADFDTVWADASVAATGLNLVLVPTGTDFAMVRRQEFTGVAQNIEHVIGGTGNDHVDASRLSGLEGVAFEGNEGNDRFDVSTAAIDKFDGGADLDTAVFSGAAANYLVVHDSALNYDEVKDLSTGSVHFLRDVEMLHFSDGDLSVADALALHTPGKIVIGTDASEDLRGGAGNDHIEGGGGVNWLTGGAGADQLIGGNSTDFIYVDADDTRIDGGGGFDYVYLDSSKPYGAEFKVAGTNVEYVGGTLANDRIDATGVTYSVVLNGNYGDDVLIGGSGNDGIDGSANNDTVTGGAGNDTFYFGGHWGNDTVTDFTHGQDVLEFRSVSGLTTMSQLTITDTAQGASIAFGADSILLADVAASTLSASDFHFLV